MVVRPKIEMDPVARWLLAGGLDQERRPLLTGSSRRMDSVGCGTCSYESRSRQNAASATGTADLTVNVATVNRPSVIELLRAEQWRGGAPQNWLRERFPEEQGWNAGLESAIIGRCFTGESTQIRADLLRVWSAPEVRVPSIWRAVVVARGTERTYSRSRELDRSGSSKPRPRRAARSRAPPLVRGGRGHRT